MELVVDKKTFKVNENKMRKAPDAKIEYSPNELVMLSYKEPLKSVNDGFGFYGALTITKDGQYIQCHICGELFGRLSRHLSKEHGMSTAEYKEKFQLSRSTSLISEVLRTKSKEKMLRWMNSLTSEEKERRLEILQTAHNKWVENNDTQPGFKWRLEEANKRGTCPDQLLAKLKSVVDSLGYVPTQEEFVKACGGWRYLRSIEKTFGGWVQGLAMLNLRPKVHIFEHGWRRYTDEELLEYLRNFVRTNKEMPTSSDFTRKLLPDRHTYYKRFGGLENAKKEAGLYELVEIEKSYKN